ncbi:molybdenum cofactor guanylyltransferase [Planctomycetales bacterium ZRK34]|nr:molybdenum cofactor guanylyltransferase [Planctomycetales bacterium ZRK34]
MIKLPVYILAGGRSSRFGSDKARAILDGLPMIQRLVEAANPIAAVIKVVAESPAKYDDLGLDTIVDLIPERGPLGGLHAALADMDQPGWLLLLSCDLLVLKPAWIDTLIAHAQGETQAVAFRADDRWQPMPGLYHTSIRPVVEQRLAESQLALQGLLREINTVEAHLPPDWPDRLQANIPADIDDAEPRD